jgi:hypothetical protein
MNKRGWIRIVEAFFSLLLIAGVFLIVYNKGYIGGDDISSRVYDLQLSVLREIELNDNLREQILCTPLPCGSLLPEVGIEDEDESFPEDVKSKIDERIPDSFICRSKICEINEICELNEYIDKDVYAQSVVIAATLEIYSPRQLKMFCWSD